MSVRNCLFQHLPGNTRNSSLLGASHEWHKPNSVRSTSKAVKEHSGSSTLPALCHQKHPFSPPQPILQSRVISHLQAQTVPSPNKIDFALPPLTKSPTQG